MKRSEREKALTPVVDRAVASAALLTDYLDLLQKLVQSAPAAQAEMLKRRNANSILRQRRAINCDMRWCWPRPGHAATDLPARNNYCAIS